MTADTADTDDFPPAVPMDVAEMTSVFRDLIGRVCRATGLDIVSEYGPVVMHDGRTWRVSAIWFVPSATGDRLNNHGFSLEWNPIYPQVLGTLARFETFGPDAWRDSFHRAVQHWPDVMELAWERLHPSLKAGPGIAAVAEHLLEAS